MELTLIMISANKPALVTTTYKTYASFMKITIANRLTKTNTVLDY